MLCLVALFVSQTSKAQWVVTDPGNLAQGIINATKNIVHTSSTATTMIKSFQETVKIYKQDGLLYLACIADKVLDLLQSIVVLLSLLIDLYSLLEVLNHRACRRGCMHDVLRGIDDALCEVAGVCHHPLRPRCLADKESHQTEHKNFQSHTVTN